MRAILSQTAEVRVRDVARFVDVPCFALGEHASTDEVLTRFARAPWVRVLSVVDESGALVGVIPLLLAVDHMLFRRDWARTLGMLDFERAPEWIRRMRASTAIDLALPAVSVQPDEPIERGMQLLHQHRLEGLPVVDDRRKVIGYLDATQIVAMGGGSEPPRRWTQHRERVGPPR